MSVYTMRFMLEKGIDIVGAFDVDPRIVGKDISVVIGGPEIGVIIQPPADVEDFLTEHKPDVCVVTTMSTLADIEEIFTICARTGVNAISTAEEAIYPWNSSPHITEKLDALAKENNCTLAGSGYPDMYWGVLVSTLAGSMHNITKIKGTSSYNVEDYGIALAKGHGAGLTIEEFNNEVGVFNDLNSDEIAAKIIGGDIDPSYMWNQNGWLCSHLGLTPISQVQKCIPMTYETDLESSTLDMTIKAGDATGMSAVVITETAEGVTLETQCIGKVYAPDEYDRNEWTFEGEPNVTIKVDQPDTVRLTCSTLVNRIPALISAQAGYVSTDKLPNSRYLATSIENYVN